LDRASALESFQKAVILDPGYAQGLAGVADAYTTFSYYGYRRPEKTMPTAIEAATRATVLDPVSAETHNAAEDQSAIAEADRQYHQHERDGQTMFAEPTVYNAGRRLPFEPGHLGSC
jgi:hypothetical protein